MAMLPIVVAAALVAGCGDKGKSDSKASQAAARVNGEEITVHQINLLLERQNGLKPEQVDAARSQALEGLIDQQLAVAKAEEQSSTVTLQWFNNSTPSVAACWLAPTWKRLPPLWAPFA